MTDKENTFLELPEVVAEKLPQPVRDAFETIATSDMLKDDHLLDLWKASADVIADDANAIHAPADESVAVLYVVHEVARNIQGYDEKRTAEMKRLYHINMGLAQPGLYRAYDQRYSQGRIYPEKKPVRILKRDN